MPGTSQSVRASDSLLTSDSKESQGDDVGNSATQGAASHPQGSSWVSDPFSLQSQTPELTCHLTVWLPACLPDHKEI